MLGLIYLQKQNSLKLFSQCISVNYSRLSKTIFRTLFYIGFAQNSITQTSLYLQYLWLMVFYLNDSEECAKFSGGNFMKKKY